MSNLAEVVLYARFLLGRGDFIRAQEILADAHGVAKEHGSVVQQLNLMPLLAEANVMKGDLEQAGMQITAAEELQLRLPGWSGLAAQVSSAASALASARVQWDAAEKSLGSALDLERAHGFAYNEAGIFLKSADLCRRRGGAGDDAKARDFRSRALEIFERCGALADAERARRLL